jgi:hypothetical protein
MYRRAYMTGLNIPNPIYYSGCDKIWPWIHSGVLYFNFVQLNEEGMIRIATSNDINVTCQAYTISFQFRVILLFNWTLQKTKTI